MRPSIKLCSGIAANRLRAFERGAGAVGGAGGGGDIRDAAIDQAMLQQTSTADDVSNDYDEVPGRLFMCAFCILLSFMY